MRSLLKKFTLTMAVAGISTLFAHSAFAVDTISSAASQTFVTNDVTTAISTITLTNVDSDMTASNDIRIHIPTGFDMTWDTSDTTFTCADVVGTPCSDINSTVTYELDDRALVLNIETDLDANDSFTVSGVSFTNFTAQEPADNLELCVSGAADNCSTVEATDDETIAIGGVSVLASAAQEFYVNQPTQLMDWTLTIVESSATPTINPTDDIIFKIPTGLSMAWDPSQTTIFVVSVAYDHLELSEGGTTCNDPTTFTCAITPIYRQADGSTACTGSDCKTMRIPVEAATTGSETFILTAAKVFEFGEATSTSQALGVEINGTTSSKTATGSHTTNLIDIVTLSVSSSSSGGGDNTPAAAPTDLAATQTEDGVVLTWTDPTDSDLNSIQVLRGEGNFSVSGDPYTMVAQGVGTYTDTNVEVGQTYKYMVRGLDSNDNTGEVSSEISITILEEAPVAEDAEASEPTEDEIVEGEAEPEDAESLPGDDSETETAEDTETEDETTEGDSEPADESDTEVVVEIEFTDTNDHWANNQIEELSEDDIVRGNPDGSFDPDNNINRAEAAALMVRVINAALGNGEPTAPATKPFNDIEVSAWYAGYVAYLLQESLIASKDNYNPGENMNRAEYLQLAVNVYNFLADELGRDAIDTSATTGGSYADLSPSDWYYGTVMGASADGFINGSSCDGGTCFNGGSDVTRAEATTVLHNMYYIGDGQGF